MKRRKASAAVSRLAALVTLLALLAGLPLLLYRLGGSPIPGRLPGWQQIGHSLTSRDNGTLFLAAIKDISWLAWAAFVFAVAAEIVAAARGRAAPRLRLGGMQTAAARLVALTMLGVSAPAALIALTQPVLAAQTTTMHQAATLPATTPHPPTVHPAPLHPAPLHPAPPNPVLASPVLAHPALPILAGGGPAAGHADAAAQPSGGLAELPPLAVFAAGLATGGTAVSLTRMRHRRHQAGRPDQLTPMPAAAPVLTTERRLGTETRPSPATWLRVALGELGAGLARTGQQLPDIAAVRILPRTMEILLASPASQPPPPFTTPADGHGLVWQVCIPADAAEPPDLPETTGDIAPGLITIGVADGGYLLADLEYLGVTVADGPPVLVDRVLAAAATELATSELAGWPDLILVGFPELIAVSDRAACCDDLAAALDLAAARAVKLRRRLGAAGPAAIRSARVADPADPDWALTVLVSRIAPTSAELTLLTDLVCGSGGMAALLPAGSADQPPGGTAILDLDYDPGQPGGMLARIAPIGLQAAPRPLTAADYGCLTSLFAVTTEEVDGGSGEPSYDGSPWQASSAADMDGWPASADTGADLSWRMASEPDAPDEAEPTVFSPAAVGTTLEATAGTLPAAALEATADGTPNRASNVAADAKPAVMADAKPTVAADPTPAVTAEAAAGTAAEATACLRIGVLGTLTINGLPAGLLPAQGQLVVALAINGRDGLSNRQLCHLLGADPDHSRPPDSLRQLIVRTRRQLGRAADGREWIEHLGSGQYALHPTTRVDWHEFDTMTSEGIRVKDAELLRDALRMIRGQPFTGCYYWWLDIALVETVRAQMVDAAATLAGLALADGDPASAARAARIGLAADATAEQLWRALMRAEHAAGNLAGVRDTWAHCLAAIAEIAADGQPHPDTTALYRELLA